MTALTRGSVLVIGAGPSGLAAAAALSSLGVDFDLVDAQNHVGGVWNIANEDAPTWPNMKLATSKSHTQFEDLRMPVSFPSFPSTDEYATYLRAYASHHGLTERFEPNKAVRSIRSFGEGEWEVDFSSGEVRPYTAIIAAHGVSQRPFLPPLWHEARESGVRTIHSKNFLGGDDTTEKDVLVIGGGQEAADIAVELAKANRRVALHPTEAHWVVPRTWGPFAGDSLARLEPTFLGRAFNDTVAETLIEHAIGRPENVGLPKPEVSVMEDEPIVSDSFLTLVNDRRIEILQDPAHLPFDRFELIVFATGYEPGADYLDPEYTSDLFLGAFPRSRRDLAVLGQVRVLGGVTPILTQQADIAAYATKEFLEEIETGAASPALARFEKLKSRADADVRRTAPRSSEKGLRGAFSGVASRVRTATRSTRIAELSPWAEQNALDSLPEDQPIRLPLTDRERLLARLSTARAIFEK